MNTHCSKGHAFTPDNTMTRTNGSRRCRECYLTYERNRKARRVSPAVINQRIEARAHRKAMHAAQDLAWNRIVDELCAATASSHEYVFGENRWRSIAHPRFVAFLAMRNIGLSYPHIGRIFGRDHSTVIYGIRKAQNLIVNDNRMARLMQRLERVAA